MLNQYARVLGKGLPVFFLLSFRGLIVLNESHTFLCPMRTREPAMGKGRSSLTTRWGKTGLMSILGLFEHAVRMFMGMGHLYVVKVKGIIAFQGSAR